MKKIFILLTVLALLFSVTATAEEGTDAIAWGEYGQVQLTEVTEWRDGLPYQVDGEPEGKWVLVIFTILDGGEFPTDALELADDILKLDGFAVAKKSANGATLNISTGSIVLTGTMAFYFDVPADYDASQAVVTVNDAEVILPAA